LWGQPKNPRFAEYSTLICLTGAVGIGWHSHGGQGWGTHQRLPHENRSVFAGQPVHAPLLHPPSAFGRLKGAPTATFLLYRPRHPEELRQDPGTSTQIPLSLSLSQPRDIDGFVQKNCARIQVQIPISPFFAPKSRYKSSYASSFTLSQTRNIDGFAQKNCVRIHVQMPISLFLTLSQSRDIDALVQKNCDRFRYKSSYPSSFTPSQPRNIDSTDFSRRIAPESRY
jgi:hypothetical protein